MATFLAIPSHWEAILFQLIRTADERLRVRQLHGNRVPCASACRAAPVGPSRNPDRDGRNLPGIDRRKVMIDLESFGALDQQTRRSIYCIAFGLLTIGGNLFSPGPEVEIGPEGRKPSKSLTQRVNEFVEGGERAPPEPSRGYYAAYGEIIGWLIHAVCTVLEGILAPFIVALFVCIVAYLSHSRLLVYVAGATAGVLTTAVVCRYVGPQPGLPTFTFLIPFAVVSGLFPAAIVAGALRVFRRRPNEGEQDRATSDSFNGKQEACAP